MLELEHKLYLEKLIHSRMTPVIIAQRAKILLLKDAGKSGTAIAEELEINRHTADLGIKRYRSRAKETPPEEFLNVIPAGAQSGNHRRG